MCSFLCLLWASCRSAGRACLAQTVVIRSSATRSSATPIAPVDRSAVADRCAAADRSVVAGHSAAVDHDAPAPSVAPHTSVRLSAMVGNAVLIETHAVQVAIRVAPNVVPNAVPNVAQLVALVAARVVARVAVESVFPVTTPAWQQAVRCAARDCFAAGSRSLADRVTASLLLQAGSVARCEQDVPNFAAGPPAVGHCFSDHLADPDD